MNKLPRGRNPENAPDPEHRAESFAGCQRFTPRGPPDGEATFASADQQTRHRAEQMLVHPHDHGQAEACSSPRAPRARDSFAGGLRPNAAGRSIAGAKANAANAAARSRSPPPLPRLSPRSAACPLSHSVAVRFVNRTTCVPSVAALRRAETGSGPRAIAPRPAHPPFRAKVETGPAPQTGSADLESSSRVRDDTRPTLSRLDTSAANPPGGARSRSRARRIRWPTIAAEH